MSFLLGLVAAATNPTGPTLPEPDPGNFNVYRNMFTETVLSSPVRDDTALEIHFDRHVTLETDGSISVTEFSFLSVLAVIKGKTPNEYREWTSTKYEGDTTHDDYDGWSIVYEMDGIDPLKQCYNPLVSQAPGAQGRIDSPCAAFPATVAGTRTLTVKGYNAFTNTLFIKTFTINIVLNSTMRANTVAVADDGDFSDLPTDVNHVDYAPPSQRFTTHNDAVQWVRSNVSNGEDFATIYKRGGFYPRTEEESLAIDSNGVIVNDNKYIVKAKGRWIVRDFGDPLASEPHHQLAKYEFPYAVDANGDAVWRPYPQPGHTFPDGYIYRVPPGQSPALFLGRGNDGFLAFSAGYLDTQYRGKAAAETGDGTGRYTTIYHNNHNGADPFEFGIIGCSMSSGQTGVPTAGVHTARVIWWDVDVKDSWHYVAFDEGYENHSVCHVRFGQHVDALPPDGNWVTYYTDAQGNRIETGFGQDYGEAKNGPKRAAKPQRNLIFGCLLISKGGFENGDDGDLLGVPNQPCARVATSEKFHNVAFVHRCYMEGGDNCLNILGVKDDCFVVTNNVFRGIDVTATLMKIFHHHTLLRNNVFVMTDYDPGWPFERKRRPGGGSIISVWSFLSELEGPKKVLSRHNTYINTVSTSNNDFAMFQSVREDGATFDEFRPEDLVWMDSFNDLTIIPDTDDTTNVNLTGGPSIPTVLSATAAEVNIPRPLAGADDVPANETTWDDLMGNYRSSTTKKGALLPS